MSEPDFYPNGVPFDEKGNERKRRVRITFEGSHCICEPKDVADMLGDDPSQYTLTDTWLSDAELEALPEFDGF